MVKACRFSSLYDGSLSKKPLGLGLERHSTTKRQEIVRVSKMKKRNPGFAGKSSPLKKNGNCFVCFGKIGGGFQCSSRTRAKLSSSENYHQATNQTQNNLLINPLQSVSIIVSIILFIGNCSHCIASSNSNKVLQKSHSNATPT